MGGSYVFQHSFPASHTIDQAVYSRTCAHAGRQRHLAQEISCFGATEAGVFPDRYRRRREGGRVDGSDDPRLDVAEPGFHLSKAPPLTASMIEALDAVESRRVLARWSARMRSVKRRVQDCARQFPTSSLVLVFTKPFRSADNRLKWCVPTRKECSSRATSLRRADA